MSTSAEYATESENTGPLRAHENCPLKLGGKYGCVVSPRRSCSSTSLRVARRRGHNVVAAGEPRSALSNAHAPSAHAASVPQSFTPE
ncbi:MAG: hypothetical protein JNK82_07805 [Myxococcaceae bacterium]|nr:hypothetical protein [Myxococcaceae bacterium]